MQHRDAEDADVRRLAESFPNISPRIVAAVLTAYDRTTGTAAEAVRATHARLADACATA